MMNIKSADYRKTVDINKKITIVTSEVGVDYIKNFTGYFNEYEVLINPSLNDVLSVNNDIFLIGNLSDNIICEYLYQKLILFTDLRYPGESEYEIRTIINPFNNKNNIIHIGYSTETGLTNAINNIHKIFKSKTTIEKMSYSNSTVFPVDHNVVEKIKNSLVPSEDIIYSIHTSYYWLLGFFAFLENNESSYESYNEGLSKFISRGKKINILGTNMHLHMVQHVITIWVLDHNGYFDVDEREEVFTTLYNWANSEEGIGYIKGHNITGKTVCHNHTLFCSLALKILSELFLKSCEYEECFDQWNDYADLSFSSFNRGGWKPLCDDSAYSVEITLVLVTIYSIFEDKHQFLNKGGINAVKWLKSIIGNDGFMPSFGDGTTYNPTATVLLRLFAYWYKDKQLISILNKLPYDVRYKIAVLCHQTYDIGLEDEAGVNDELEINIIKPDEEIFYCFDNSPSEAINILDKNPTYKIEDCFDKFSIRSKSIHLLIDGISSPYTHAYHDGGGLLDFSFNGITWLVEENCYRWPETEHCNMITITKDGHFYEPDPFAKLIKYKKYKYGVYVLLELDDYNGCTWNREYILINKLGLVIRDIMTVKEDDNYAICFHCKTPAIGHLENNQFIVERKDKFNNEHKMIISDIDNLPKNYEIINIGEMLFMCDGIGENQKTYNHGSYTSEIGINAWNYKYNDETLCVSHIETRISGYYKKNEKVVLTHLFAIDQEFKAKIAVNQMIINNNKDKYIYEVMSAKNAVSNYKKEKSNTIVKTDEKLPLIKQVSIDKGLAFNDYLLLKVDNTLHFYHNFLKIKEIQFKTEVTQMCLFENQYIIGNEDGLILCYSKEGQLIFKTQLKRITSIYATWETNKFMVTSLSEVENNKTKYIAIGTGDNQLRLMDKKGKVLWSSYIYATIPDKIFCFDIENDGENEIITIGSESMNAGCVYNFKFTGQNNKYPRIGGWLNNIIDISDDNKILVCGLKYGNNLIALKKNRDFEIIFKEKLGGKVMGVILHNKEIFAVTSKGYLLKYDLDGKNLKLVDLNSSAIKLKLINDTLIIETSLGVYTYNENCEIKDSYIGYKILDNEYLFNKEQLIKMNNI